MNLPETYVQNTTTATIHWASLAAVGRAVCGYCYSGPTFRARRRKAAKSFREVQSIADIPGHMLCERCLPNERKAALNKDLVHDGLSGDEA